MERIRENRVSFRSAPALPRLSFGTKPRRVERMRCTWWKKEKKTNGGMGHVEIVLPYPATTCDPAVNPPSRIPSFLPSFLTCFFLLCFAIFGEAAAAAAASSSSGFLHNLSPNPCFAFLSHPVSSSSDVLSLLSNLTPLFFSHTVVENFEILKLEFEYPSPKIQFSPREDSSAIQFHQPPTVPRGISAFARFFLASSFLPSLFYVNSPLPRF